MAKNWIEGAIRNKGALHRALGVPQGDTLPKKKVAQAIHSSSAKVRKEATLARTLRGFN